MGEKWNNTNFNLSNPSISSVFSSQEASRSRQPALRKLKPPPGWKKQNQPRRETAKDAPKPATLNLAQTSSSAVVPVSQNSPASNQDNENVTPTKLSQEAASRISHVRHQENVSVSKKSPASNPHIVTSSHPPQ